MNSNENGIFVSPAIDYGITGSRTWHQLSSEEQDDYLIACFNGESARAAVEQSLQLYDRAASSIANHLLGLFRQSDIRDGVSHYEPGTPRVATEVLNIRRSVLEGTPLGGRLELALARREGRETSEMKDVRLSFFSLAPATSEMEVLTETASGGAEHIPDFDGIKRWNDFELLKRVHGAYERNRRPRVQPRADDDEAVDAIASAAPAVMAARLRTAAPATAPSALSGASEQERADGVGKVLIPAGLAAALLLWALVPTNPYGYYTLLRVVVFGVFAYLTYTALQREWIKWSWTLGLMAVLYNPFLRFRLDRETWSVVNVATVVLLGVYIGWYAWRRARG